MKCPYCGSTRVRPVNILQQATATTASAIVSFGLIIFNPNKGPAIKAGKEISKKICPNRKFRCMNPFCKKTFEEPLTL